MKAGMKRIEKLYSFIKRGVNKCFSQAVEEAHLAEVTPKLSSGCGTGVTPTCDQWVIVAWFRAVMLITLVP